jgi:hypothetical protein
MLTYELPLAEIVLDFFDKLKSVSRGYASHGLRVQGVPRRRRRQGRHADQRRPGRRAVHDRAPQPEPVPRPRGGGQDARADPAPDVRRGHPGGHRRQHHRPRDIKALRKNVLAKCYGGDITRKRKLLEKQKAGKKRMKQIGTVEVPQEAFLAILQVDD